MCLRWLRRWAADWCSPKPSNGRSSAAPPVVTDDPVDAVVGLDFGTSRTKVVIRLPYFRGEHAVAVDFAELGESGKTHLLPTRVYEGPGGIFCLQSAKVEPTVTLAEITELKEGLFTASDRDIENAEVVAAAYLALVLVQARRWFQTTQRNVMGDNRTIRWSVNLGVPSPHVSNKEESPRFLRIGYAAWRLADEAIEAGRDTVSRDRTLSVLLDTRGNAPEPDCDLAICPEIVAGAVSYAQSNLRRDGLHLMLDVGASTMDVCGFFLYPSEERDDAYTLYVTYVDLLGVARLNRTRGSERQEFARKCDRRLRGVVKELSKDMAPTAAVFKPGGVLPLLLIGGGSWDPFYRKRIVDLEKRMQQYFRIPSDGLVQLDVPKPPTVDTDIDFRRLAVAWGLSYPRDDIGRITRCTKSIDVIFPWDWID